MRRLSLFAGLIATPTGATILIASLIQPSHNPILAFGISSVLLAIGLVGLINTWLGPVQPRGIVIGHKALPDKWLLEIIDEDGKIHSVPFEYDIRNIYPVDALYPEYKPFIGVF